MSTTHDFKKRKQILASIIKAFHFELRQKGDLEIHLCKTENGWFTYPVPYTASNFDFKKIFKSLLLIKKHQKTIKCINFYIDSNKNFCWSLGPVFMMREKNEYYIYENPPK